MRLASHIRQATKERHKAWHKVLFLAPHRIRGSVETYSKRLHFTTNAVEEALQELQMPALSPTMSVGTLSRWLIKEGDKFQAGDVLCQIETDKAVVDYELQEEGILAKILVPEGSVDIPIGTPLALSVEDRETFEKVLGLVNFDKYQSVGSENESQGNEAEITQFGSTSSGNRQPLIKFLGKRDMQPQKQDDISRVVHSDNIKQQASTNITAEKVEAHKEEIGDFVDIPVSNMRRIIAKRLLESKVTVPHHYTRIECRIDRLNEQRQMFKNIHGIKISINDFIIKAVSLAIRDVPEIKSYYDIKTKTLLANTSTDISVAVATASGLITPIVRGADSLGLSGINKTFLELVRRARENRLKPEEFQGGSFTISNLGGFGIDSFTAVINPPQSCILAVGRGRKVVVPSLQSAHDAVNVDIQPQIATILDVTLSADRRVVDDVISGQFLQCFKRYMECPELMAV